MFRRVMVRPKSNFTMVPNVAIFDERLSRLARSILIEMMARRPGWETNADKLAAEAKQHRGALAESRRAYRRAFTELVDAGYMTRQRTRIPKGREHGGDYTTVLTVYNTPQVDLHGGVIDGGFTEDWLASEWPTDGTSSVLSTDS